MTVAAVTQHPVHDIVERALALESEPRLYAPEISSDEPTAYARDKTFIAIKLIKSHLAQLDPMSVSV